MRLLFLGTGTAGAKLLVEGTLAEGQRRCTSVRIDHDVLVDLGLQSFDHAAALGEDVSGITDIFISHTHRDHYMKDALLAYVNAVPHKLRIHCHRGAVVGLKLTDEEAARVEVHPVESMETFEAAGMTVTALPANHIAGGPEEQPLHYIFRRDGQTLFYGLDGGWFRAEAWEYMRRDPTVFDAMILEATVGEDPGNFRIGTHNTVPMLRLLLCALRDNGMIRPDTTLIASHIGGKMGKEGNAEMFAGLGMIEAVDGLKVEF